MATLLEMTAEIVKAHAAASKLTSEELLGDLRKVYSALQRLGSVQLTGTEEKSRPALTIKQAFKKDEVICMVCGKGGMKSLSRHLNFIHDLKPSAYRKQFGIRRTQALTATSFTESRRAMALERGLADNLIKAREVRASKIKARKPATKSASAAR
jgi:predicted transcriptional regulator